MARSGRPQGQPAGAAAEEPEKDDAGGAARLAVVRGVADHRALRGRHAEPFHRGNDDVGLRLARGRIVGGDDHVHQLAEIAAGRCERGVELFHAARGGECGPESAAAGLSQERLGAVEERDAFAGDDPGVLVRLAFAQAIAHRGIGGAAEDGGHEQITALSDLHGDAVGADRKAFGGERELPGPDVQPVGIEERAVQVEDERIDSHCRT